MQLPQPSVNSNFNQFENQESTQLTSGGKPGPGEFQAGDIVDGTYEIISLIGSGGMGNVYKARHSIMKQEYALKTLSSEQVNETAWRRFQNEAQAIARMNHANVVGIYNLGLHDGRLPFYVMDLLKGQTLLDLLRQQGSLSVKQALLIFGEVATGIGYAHKKGIVHRDIKPGNIVIIDANGDGNSQIKIVDFGIAKLSGIKDQRNQELTSVGEICGSPFYMSPEQCNGGRVDTRSDIYSFGCTLFEALTGQVPFRGRSAVETMLMHQSEPPPTLRSVSGKQFPPMLEQAMATMLAKVPMNRYQTMERIIQDFSAILEGREEPINPYITQAHKRFEPRSDYEGAKEDFETDRNGTVEPSAKRKGRKILLIAGSVGAALGLTAAAVYSAGALYSFMTPKSSHQSNMYFIHTASEASTSEESGGISSADNSGVFAGVAKAIPSVDEQKPGHSQSDLKPYSTKLELDNEPSISFNFPTDFTIGTIQRNKDDKISALGNRIYKLTDDLTYEPDLAVGKYPQYCQRFQPGDLKGLTISPSADSPSVVKAVSGIKGIERLTIKACSNLKDTCIPELSKLDTVTNLNADDSGFTGKGLARLPYIKRLKTLSYIAGTDGEALCRALAGSNAIRVLEIDEVALTPACFRAISTMPNLKRLHLQGTQITDRDLRELAKLPHLKYLLAPYCGITPAQIEILKTFPALKELEVSSRILSDRDFKRIQQALPGVAVK
ncbi:MAG: protein kinase [Cyanobacteria bacterium REEB67]|nr:protein kinase [Cyanobacteria bacterium REEB67]